LVKVSLGAAVQDAALVIKPPLSVSGADVPGAAFVGARLTAPGVAVRRVLFVIKPPLTVLGTAVEGAASMIKPAFSGADVQALTVSGAAP
jgi:hypothetical protein